MKKSHTILLLSSSTGGHAIPILELYKELSKDRSLRAEIIHSGSAIEKELFRDYKTIECKSGKINRYQPLKNFNEVWHLFKAIFKSIFIIMLFRPTVIFSKGGFNGAPFLIWARMLNIPYFLHESDSEMGAANDYFYKRSVKTFVAFPVNVYHQDKNKLCHSGFILRNFEPQDTKTEYPVILVTGGSQGAQSINEKVLELLPELLDKYKVIHHIGITDLQKVQEALECLSPDLLSNYEYFEFSTDKFNKSLADANLVISRAGSTIGELAKLSKASILIPYPYAASDHQTKNARFLEKHGAAIVIKQEQLTVQALKERIDFLLKDPRNAKIVGENIHKTLKTDGLKIVSEELLKFMRQR